MLRSASHQAIRLLLPALFALAIVALWTATAQACPTCKNGLEETAEGMIRGYFWSILFMMSMPFTILGCFSGYMYYLVRRERAKQQSPQAETAPTEKAEALTHTER